MITNYPMDTWPNELIENVQTQLPLYDRAFVIPLVSKRWLEISEKSKAHVWTALHEIADTYPRLPNDRSQYSVDDYIEDVDNKYTNEQRMKLFKIISKNTLISQLMDANLKFYSEKYKSGCGGHFQLFPINFNPDTLKFTITYEGSWGDIQTRHILQIFHSDCDLKLTGYDKISHVYPSQTTIQIKNYNGRPKRQAYFWVEKIDPCAINYLVLAAIKYELNHYISNISENNLIYFPNLKNISDFSNKILISCNYLGEIEPIPNNHCFNFAIIKYKTVNDEIFLKLESDSLNASLEDLIILNQLDFKEYLRWCILSKTVEKIAKKLGLNSRAIDQQMMEKVSWRW